MLIKIAKRVDDGRYGSFLGGAILSKIMSWTLFAGLVSSGAFNVVKVIEVKNLQVEVSSLKLKNTELSGELDKCKFTLDSQNSKIIDIQTDAQADINSTNKVNDQLKNIVNSQQKEIDKLKKEHAPQSCDESKEWLKNNIDIFKESQ